MKPMTIVYTPNMEASKIFYCSISQDCQILSENPYWTELSFSGQSIALHLSDPLPETNSGHIGLAFSATEKLETLVSFWQEKNIQPVQGILDEAFGRSILLKDLNGLLIQVNEHDKELYPKT